MYTDSLPFSQVGKKVIQLVIYELPSHHAAWELYIAMKKNITHSSQDLETAYRLLEVKLA
jgi:hypothetical protein